MREGTTAFRLLNGVLLQIAWFACVLGSANHAVWIGWLACAAFITVHFALVENRRPDATLALTALGTGTLFESLNRALGAVEPASDVLPSPFPPTWLLLLWIAFALSIRHSMSWLSRNRALSAAFGAIVGPLAEHGGERLGGVHISPDPLLGWVLVGAQWAVAMPFLFTVAARATSPRAPRSPESPPS